MLLDLLFHHHRDASRFQDWNAWGVSWVGNWADSWGPYEVDDRRPKSTNRLKLQKISEGRGYLVTSKAATRFHGVPAEGVHEVPTVPLVYPGGAIASHSRCNARASQIRAQSGARTGTLRASAVTFCGAVSTASGATAQLHNGRSFTYTLPPAVCSTASVTLAGSNSTSGYELLSARGARNLSNSEIIGVVRTTIDKRRISSTFL